MTRKLLIETIMVASSSNNLRESVGLPRYTIVENTGGVLKVRLPVTYLDKKNENGRTYSRNVMEKAVREAKPAFENKELLCTIDGHPEEAHVDPGNASHIVTAAWCEDGCLWNEWEVMETAKGNDLRALIKAEASFGVSIRGLGSQDNYGNILEDYSYLGTDGVGQPSARIRTRPQIVNPGPLARESIQASTSKIQESSTTMNKHQFITDFNKSLRGLKENMNKTDGISIVRNLMALEESLNNEGPSYLTITESHTLANQLARLKSIAQEKLSGADIRTALDAALRENTENKARIKNLEAGLQSAVQRLENARNTISTLNSRVGFAVRGKRGIAKALEAARASLTSLRSENSKLRAMNEVAIAEAASIEAQRRILVRKVAEADMRYNVAVNEASAIVADLRKQLGESKAAAKKYPAPKTESTAKVIDIDPPAKNESALGAAKSMKVSLSDANKSGEVLVPGFR